MDQYKSPRNILYRPATNFEYLAGQLLLQEYTPAAVLVTESGEILYTSGQTELYIDSPSGRSSRNLFILAREGINHGLNEAFYRAICEKNTVTVTGVKLHLDNAVHLVDISVRPILEPDILVGLLLIVFIDKGPNVLLPAQDALLQSLAASREQMRQINNELQLVNEDLQQRAKAIAVASNDMRNMLAGADVATIFLDENLLIRRFTAQATQLFRLIPADIGRPLDDLAQAIHCRALIDDAREVMRSHMGRERQVIFNGVHWFALRIMPYQTIDNRIEGLVISLLNISSFKHRELELCDTLRMWQHVFDHALTGMAIVSWDEQWRKVNPSLCAFLGYSEVELCGMQPFDIIPRDILQNLSQEGGGSETRLLHFSHKSGRALPARLEASVLRNHEGKPENFFFQFQSLKSHPEPSASIG